MSRERVVAEWFGWWVGGQETGGLMDGGSQAQRGGMVPGSGPLAWLHRKEPPPFLRAHLMSQLSRSQTTVVQSIAPPHIPANPIIFSLASTEKQKYTKTEKDKYTKYKHRQIQSIALAIISSL